MLEDEFFHKPKTWIPQNCFTKMHICFSFLFKNPKNKKYFGT